MKKYIISILSTFIITCGALASNENSNHGDLKQRRTFVTYDNGKTWSHQPIYSQLKVVQSYKDRNFISFNMVLDGTVNIKLLELLASGVKLGDKVNFRIFLGQKHLRDVSESDLFTMPCTKDGKGIFNPGLVSVRSLDEMKLKSLKARIEKLQQVASDADLVLEGCQIPVNFGPSETLDQRHEHLSRLRDYYHKIKEDVAVEEKRVSLLKADQEAQKAERVRHIQHKEAAAKLGVDLESEDDDTINSSDDEEDRAALLGKLRETNTLNDTRIAAKKREVEQLVADNRAQQTAVDALVKVHAQMDKLGLEHGDNPTYEDFDEDTAAPKRKEIVDKLNADLKIAKAALAKEEAVLKKKDAALKEEARALEKDKQVLARKVARFNEVQKQTSAVTGEGVMEEEAPDLDGDFTTRAVILQNWEQKLAEAQAALKTAQAHAKLVEGRNKTRESLVKQLQDKRKAASVEDEVNNDAFTYKNTKEEMEEALTDLQKEIDAVPPAKDK